MDQLCQGRFLVNAQKVRDDILRTIDGLIGHPLKFPPDKFKNENDGIIEPSKSTTIE